MPTAGGSTSLGAVVPMPPRTGDVSLRYVGVRAFSTRSAHTGRAYTCVGMNVPVAVDPRDAELLLRTRVFTRP
jgi:hypothetical protein